MPSFPSTSFFEGWRKPIPTYLYAVVDSASEDGIEELKSTSKSKSRRKRLAYGGLMVIAWLSSAVVLSFIISAIRGRPPKPTASQWFPEVPSRTYVFDENEAFAQVPNAVSNAAWDSLMPHGRGRVVIEKPWKYGLPSLYEPPLEEEEYGISVFHQLHCLGVLRYSWFALLGDQDPTIELPHGKPSHLAPAAATHCFDFIRQALMCSADTTIELARYRGTDGKVRTAHGWGIEHQCKDWDSVWEWTMKFRAHDNRTGIL